MSSTIIRGRLRPHHLAALAAQGWTVHRIGRAAYVHGAEVHTIFGVWSGDAAPAWAARLGRVSPAYVRRLERLDRERSGRRFLRDGRGRFLARLPWYRVAPVRAYSWEPARLSLVDEEDRRAAERRAARGYWS